MLWNAEYITSRWIKSDFNGFDNNDFFEGLIKEKECFQEDIDLYRELLVKFKKACSDEETKRQGLSQKELLKLLIAEVNEVLEDSSDGIELHGQLLDQFD